MRDKIWPESFTRHRAAGQHYPMLGATPPPAPSVLSLRITVWLMQVEKPLENCGNQSSLRM